MTAALPLRVAMTVEQYWQPVPGGSGTYIRELISEYVAVPGLSVTGLSAWHRAPPPDDPDVGSRVRLHRSRLPRPALYEAWQRGRIPREPAGQDVVHATTWAIPGHRAPLIVTVHDLAFRHDPGHFTPRGVRFFERGLEITRAEAAAVIVPSLATKDECLAAGIEAERLHVVSHGVRVPRTTPEDVAGFRRRHGLNRPYVLWAGTREPRKNLARLVAAFDEFRRSGEDVDLALVGPDGWGPEMARLTGSTAERVRILGRLPSAELDAAYAGALVFCYPSLREGYGMPVTEAMAHGIPVVTSRGTATEEAAGGAAVLVDPLDPRDIARGIAAAAEPSAREALKEASLLRAGQLNWARTAAETAGVLRQAANAPRTGRRRGIRASRSR